MAEESHGALFKNDKGDNPKRPDYRGSGQCPCCSQEFWIKAWDWIAKSNGQQYYSLALEPKVEKAPAQRPQTGSPVTPEEAAEHGF